MHKHGTAIDRREHVSYHPTPRPYRYLSFQVSSYVDAALTPLDRQSVPLSRPRASRLIGYCCALVVVCKFIVTNDIVLAQELVETKAGQASTAASQAVGIQAEVRLYVLSPTVLNARLRGIFGQHFHPIGSNNRLTVILGDRTGRNGVQISGTPDSSNLTLVGSPHLVRQTVQLIRALDHSQTAPTRTLVFRRYNSAQSNASPPLHDPTSSNLAPTAGGRVSPVQHVVELAQAPAQQPNTNQPNLQLDSDLRQRLRDLGDDVQVEVLPDLDVVILRGRDADIDELAKIIKRLEELAAGAQPQIEVYQLKHAPGEAISEIIGNVAEDYTGPRQGRVTVTPLSKPNALLIVGWGNALQATLDLIRKLDQPVAAENELRVIQLRNAAADETATTIQQFFDNRPGLGPKVQVTADRRTNSLIIHAAPRDLAEVRGMVEQLDVARGDSVNRATVIQLKHSLATDLATVLQNALQSAQSTDASQRAAALELLTVSEEGRELLLSGDMGSVQVTPSARTNALIVTGPPATVRLIAELIRRLDTPRDAAQIKVFRITHGDAASLVQVLESLLLSDGDDPQLPNAAGETSLTPLRFSVEERTNSIIAAGSEGDLRIVEALLMRLDEEDASRRVNAVYHLKNAPAADVARTINDFLRSERLIESAAEGAVSLTQQIEREVVVVPEVVSNKLILSATPRFFDEVQDLIRKLDEPPAQVMIQVLIGEVALNNTEEFGVELGLQSSVLFDRSLLGDLLTTVQSQQVPSGNTVITATEEIIQAASNTPGFNFNNSPLGNSGSDQALARSGTVGTQGLSSFAVGRINNELGFGGLVLSASSDSVSMLIRALEESRRLEILSRPQIRTLDNQPAMIQVGQNVPFILNSTITQFGQTNSIEFRDVGLILGVTPRISPDGTVVMEIDAEKSTLGPEEQGIPIAATIDGTIIRAPSIETTRAQTTVSAASGETIVLGGLITKSTAVISRSVPYLSDIPVLGDIFRYDGVVKRRTELMIILTPQVIYSATDNERIKQIEMARMSWCTADVYDLHGDVDYHFPEDVTNFDEPTEVIYPDVQPRGNADAVDENDIDERQQ